MKIFLDTNVILDFFIERKEFEEDSEQLFEYILSKKVIAVVCSISYGTIDYIMEKNKYNKTVRKERLNWLYRNCNTDFLNHSKLRNALNSNFSDFEDALQYYSAQSSQCDFIITRNPKDYQTSEIPVYTTQGFLDLLRANT